MKICFFIGFYPLIKGGAEYQMKLIAQELKNIDIFFISVGHTETKILYDGDIKVYTLNLNRYYYNKLFLYYPFFKQIKKILDAEIPDIIYQRILNSFSYHLASYSKQNRIPFYIHIADCYSLQFGKDLTSKIRKYMFMSVLQSDVRFVVQTEEQEVLLSRWGVSPVLKIYNLHPLSLKEVLLLKVDLTQKNIVWIGSARKVKRLDLYLDLAERYRRNESWRFVIIGRLETGDYADILSTRISQLGNVDYLGEQDNVFINKYLEDSADLLVNTSDSEGFSNTFIQAWLRGVPVISLNSNPDNILSNYKFGIYCSADFEKLSESVELLLTNEMVFNEFRANALSEAPDLFSLKKNINKIRQILNIK